VIYKRHVVYLITSPLSKRDYERFGIQRWLDRGWEVKVFDFTKFLKPEFWSYVNGYKLSFDFDGLKIIEDVNSALKLIENLEGKTVFIDIIGPSGIEQKIRQAAKKKGVLLVLKFGRPNFRESVLSNLLKKVKKALIDPGRVFTTIIDKIGQFREDAPDYVVLGGTINPIPKTSKGKPAIIITHTLDYDFFLTDKSSQVESNDGGLVFLDQDSVWHSDFVHIGTKAAVTAENYYSTINTGLSQIADDLGYNVRVAAHPRSDYDNKSFKYSFPILKDKTYELIKQASVVVSHDSTALLWAIILRKPIILATTDELHNQVGNIESDIARLSIDKFAFLIGKDVVNLNRIPNKFDWRTQLLVDETKYQNYIETYVKRPGSLEKPVWEIVIDRLEKDLFHEIRSNNT